MFSREASPLLHNQGVASATAHHLPLGKGKGLFINLTFVTGRLRGAYVPLYIFTSPSPCEGEGVLSGVVANRPPLVPGHRPMRRTPPGIYLKKYCRPRKGAFFDYRASFFRGKPSRVEESPRPYFCASCNISSFSDLNQTFWREFGSLDKTGYDAKVLT